MFPPKMLLLIIVLAASLASATTTGASTVVVTGGPSVSGTGGASLLTLNNTGKTVNCTTSNFGASVAALTSGSFPLQISSSVAPTFGNCNAVGGFPIIVICIVVIVLIMLTPTALGATRGAVRGVKCIMALKASTACRVSVTGSSGVIYTNPANSLTVDRDHQSLATVQSTNGSGGICAQLPNDSSAQYGSSGFSSLAYAVSPTVTITAS